MVIRNKLPETQQQLSAFLSPSDYRVVMVEPRLPRKTVGTVILAGVAAPILIAVLMWVVMG